MKRYPGLKPFTAQEQNIFFGRAEEKIKLYQKIKLEQIIVLFSKSGMGKSSLLNAGVIPEIIAQNYAVPLKIRIGSFSEADTNQPTPIQKLISELNISKKSGTDFTLDKLIPNENSIWYYLKLLQSQNFENKLPYILFFDQFEELFTYPKKQQIEFFEQMANVLRVSIPENFSNLLQKVFNSEIEADFTDEDFNLISSNLQIKVVFAIRSDRMSLLNEITPYIPDVLHNCFELKPLTIAQAKDAITLPANIVSSDFSTPVFGFENSALNKIIDNLKDDKQNIESFQLQIICQYCENLIEERFGINKNQQFRIIENDISDIKNILETFYTKLIDNLKYNNEQEKKNVYKVLGEDFIFEKEQRRILVYEGRAEERLGKSLLKQLTDSFILRSEKNSSGGFVYELSHDTTVAPILKAYIKLREEEQKRIAEEKRLEEERKQRERIKRQRTIIAIVSVAAVVSIALGIFGLWQMSKAKQKEKIAIEQTEIANNKSKEAEENLLQFKKGEAKKKILIAQNMIDLEQFEVAKSYLDSAKVYLEGTNNELDSLLNICNKEL